jgi:tripartite-type tricarboxylate transporter receptor subunit TctC
LFLWNEVTDMKRWTKLPSAASLIAAILMAAAWSTAISPAALAQAYPSKPIRFIAPFPPGGSSDVLARYLGQKLSESLGQPLLIENHGGASGNIGHQLAARAPGDGYTLLISSSSILCNNPYLFKNLGFDPVADFAPVSMVASAGQVLAVAPSVPAKDVRELMALIRTSPGRLNYGSGGVGIQSHISAELFKTMAGLDLFHVPYKGTAQAVLAAVSGQVQVVFGDMIPAMPQIRAGKLRALAVTTLTRAPQLPDVPTMAEAGLPGYDASLWWGMLFPRGAVADLVGRLNAELDRTMKLAEVQQKYAELGVVTEHSSPLELADAIQARGAQMAKVLKAAGVQPE